MKAKNVYIKWKNTKITVDTKEWYKQVSKMDMEN